MTIKEHLKLNGKELDIKYPIELLDNNGNKVYYEGPYGFWCKSEYDNNGNRTYFEDSDSFWFKSEFDNNGNRTHYEDSNGDIKDDRLVKEMSIKQIQELVGFKVKITE